MSIITPRGDSPNSKSLLFCFYLINAKNMASWDTWLWWSVLQWLPQTVKQTSLMSMPRH